MLRSARRVGLGEKPEHEALPLEVGEVDGLSCVGCAREVGRRITNGEQVRVRHKESLEEGQQHQGGGRGPG